MAELVGMQIKNSKVQKNGWIKDNSGLLMVKQKMIDG